MRKKLSRGNIESEGFQYKNVNKTVNFFRELLQYFWRHDSNDYSTICFMRLQTIRHQHGSILSCCLQSNKKNYGAKKSLGSPLPDPMIFQF